MRRCQPVPSRLQAGEVFQDIGRLLAGRAEAPKSNYSMARMRVPNGFLSIRVPLWGERRMRRYAGTVILTGGGGFRILSAGVCSFALPSGTRRSCRPLSDRRLSMAVNMRPRTKDHWTLRLRIKRPGSAASGMLLALAAIQAVLLFLTASSFGRGGGLYGCASPC